MLKNTSIVWIVVLLFVLSASGVSISSAGTRQYFDKHGNEITEEEYLILTGRKKASAQEKESLPSTVSSEETPSHKADQKESIQEKKYSDEDDSEDVGIDLNIVSETIIRGFERDIVPEGNSLVLPIYEYITIDSGKSKTKGLSFHFQGWGRLDVADSGYFENDIDGALLHMYLQYTQPEDGYSLKLGRQQVFKGVSNESIDGIWAETNFTPFFVFSAYGGLPVGLDEVEGRSGDLIWGGRAANRMLGAYEIGVSYKRMSNNSTTADEIAGVDFFAALPLNAGFNGYSTYNLQTEDWAEHSFDLQFGIQELYFKLVYEQFSYADYFINDKTSSNIFGFLKDTGEILTVMGGDGYWRQLGNIALGGNIKYYNYDIRKDSAMYYAGLLKGYLTDRNEVGGELGYMDGQTPETRYMLTRAYFYWDSPFDFMQTGFLTGDVVYVIYDQDIFGKDRSVFVSLGTGFNLYGDALKLKLSGDYSDDPFFNSDIRGMLVLLYSY